MGEWAERKFSDLMKQSVRNGIYKKKEFHGRGAKIINMGELFAFPRMRSVPMKRVELTDSEFKRFDIQKNDLIFARRSLVAEGAGKCSIVLDVDEETTFESSIIRARLDSAKANPLFYYYFFNSRPGLHCLDTIRRQVAVAGITGTDLTNLDVPVPTLEEQDSIVSILSPLDDKIELNRRMNGTLEAMARALFKDWFVEFGPTRAKIEGREPYLAPHLWDLFPDTLDDDRIPTGWKIEPLYDQANWVNGAAYKNMHFSEESDALPVVKIAELKAGITDKTKFTNTELGQKYRIDSGDLLFSWSGNPDTSIDAFIWQFGPAWLNQHIFAVRENGKMAKAQLYAMLKTLMPEFAEIARNKQTTGLGHVTKADMQRMTVCIGSPAARAVFQDLVDPIFQRLVGNLFESRELIQTRDLLLPKLMSGEICLRDAEKRMEAVA